MNAKPIRVGILGLGNMGKNHLRILSMLRSVDIAYIHDRDSGCLAAMADKYNVRALAEVPDDFEDVDALFVLTPTSTHADYIERALPHARNIFVEKPITQSLASTRALTQHIQAAGVPVQVGFIERFNPAVHVLKGLTSGSSGIINIDFSRTSKTSSRINDVDVITDLMIHDIDLAIHLNGPVRRVVAHGKAESDFVDFASATFVHESGAQSRLLASRITEKKRRLIEATCEDKFISCDLLRKEVFVNTQSFASKSKSHYVVTSTEETVLVSQQEALLNEINEFIEACGSGDFSKVPTSTDSLAVMELAEEIHHQIVRAK